MNDELVQIDERPPVWKQSERPLYAWILKFQVGQNLHARRQWHHHPVTGKSRLRGFQFTQMTRSLAPLLDQ
jgi:hypothetical protein